jgi:hypothetical protein
MVKEEQVAVARPVDLAELGSFEALGEQLVVPPQCIDCIVLDTKKIAEGIGMASAIRDRERQYFPESKIPELRSNLVERSDDAVSGACRFIVQQECWRYEEVVDQVESNLGEIE